MTAPITSNGPTTTRLHHYAGRYSRDTFAGGKRPEIGCFVRAKVSSVSSRGSDPPALVSSVSGEVVGGCCEVAVTPISVKKLAQQAWILGETEKKFALQAKKR